MKLQAGSDRRGWPLILALAGLLIYGTGLGIQYYSDDFQFLYFTVSRSYLHWFTHPNPFVVYAYRPIEAAVLLFVQSHFGMNTAPVHLVALAAHVLLSWLVFVVMRHFGFRPLQAMLGSAFMLVSQANAHAVLSNDTLSQVLGSFFGCVSLWFLHLSLDRGETGRNASSFRRWLYPASLSVFALSLLSKETSFGFLLMAGAVILLHSYKRKGLQGALLQTVVQGAPYLLIGILYLAIRSQVGVKQATFGGAEDSEFSIGLNVLQNLALFSIAGVVPASTASSFVALKTQNYTLLAAIVAGMSVFLGGWMYGLLRDERRGHILFFAALVVMGLFPALLARHVSELYLYNSTPFLSILVGIGWGRVLEGSAGMKTASVLAPIFGLLLVGHVAAVQSKALLMKRNGERAALLLRQITPLAAHVPKGGTLVLLNPTADRPKYSVFLLHGFDVLEFGSSRVKYLSGRQDIKVRIVDPEEWAETARELPESQRYVLTLEGDRVHPISQNI